MALTATVATAHAQQEPAKVRLETSETIFSVLTAINMCGYDQDLASAEPIRQQVRNAVAQALQSSAEAADAREQLCRFYRDKQQTDAALDLAQYISLALNLSPPPQFAPTIKEADMPPDASNVLGFIPLLQRFYDTTGLHRIWLKLQPEYERQLALLHEPVAKMLLETELYLKLPISGYLGRQFVVYVEPMGAPSQVNARNYGSDYFLVESPQNATISMEQVRHTYLHYILDPMMQKRANTVKRLEPLLEVVKAAPIADSYKNDASLLVIESLIRAVEARTITGSKAPKELERARSAKAEESMEQGFILTRYFYEALVGFEKEPASLRDTFGDMLYNISVDREKKRGAQIQFSAQAAPEIIRASKQNKPKVLDEAEQRLAERDAEGARKLAQQAISEKSGDPARALFIMGRAATLTRDVDGAQLLFEQTLEMAREPRIVAWSHIHLGRILDLKCNREAALAHYRAAQATEDTAPEIKIAAEKGINETPESCAKQQ